MDHGFCQSRWAETGRGRVRERRASLVPLPASRRCVAGDLGRPEGVEAGRGALRQGWARLRGLTDALSHRRAERVPQEKVHCHGCRFHQPVISADSNRQRRQPVT